MHLTPAADILSRAGLGVPPLRVLQPTNTKYDALILQPRGDLEGGEFGVRHRDVDAATLRFGKFLEQAADCHADLAITPEYSTPWAAIIMA